MTDVFKTIIVDDRHHAREVAEDGQMFHTRLSPTGELPATHWISSGYIPQEMADQFPEATDEDPFVAMERMGLQLVVEE